MTIAQASSMVITPDKFDPPLKRIEPTVPGYWTVDELAAELDVSRRFIQYCIKGDLRKKNPMYLKNYKVGISLLVPDAEALVFLWNMRQPDKNT